MLDPGGAKSREGTLRFVEGRWLAADRAVLRPGFELLLEGVPVTPRALSEYAGVDRTTGEDALRSGPVGLDPGGRLVELFGVMLSPTMHRIVIDGHVVFSCCALVAHMLPALVAKQGEIESVDPISRRVVRVSIHDRDLVAVSPGQAAGTFPLAPEASDDVRSAFCSHLHHFADRRSAQEFASADPRRSVIGITEMHALALELVDRIWNA